MVGLSVPSGILAEVKAQTFAAIRSYLPTDWVQDVDPESAGDHSTLRVVMFPADPQGAALSDGPGFTFDIRLGAVPEYLNVELNPSPSLGEDGVRRAGKVPDDDENRFPSFSGDDVTRELIKILTARAEANPLSALRHPQDPGSPE